MNGGLIDTPIRMQDGSYKPLSSVEIDDVVFPNSKVCGTVVILPKDMKIRTVEVKGRRITGGTNVQILDKHLGCSYNIMDSIEKHSSTDNPLYHLITDKGGFYVNNVFILFLLRSKYLIRIYYLQCRSLNLVNQVVDDDRLILNLLFI